MELTIAVYMITYNHKPYIRQAIESIMCQITNYTFELFIGDDKSNDGTSDICSALKDEYPGKINLVVNNINCGANKNAINIFNKCFNSNAKYIALCEGDDYWTDPHKLQKQVDFLEANKDYSISFHKVYELIDDKKLILSNLNTSATEETYIVEDLAKSNFIHTPSVVFRNGLIKKLPAWYEKSPIGDYVLHMLNAKYGKIKYFPEPMAVYRRHSNGIWSNKSQLYQSMGWVWMLAHLATEFKNTEVEKILLNQKAENDSYIASCQREPTLSELDLNSNFIKILKKKLKTYFS